MPGIRNRLLAVLVLLPVLVLSACGGSDASFRPDEWKTRRESRKTGSSTVKLAEALISSRTLRGMNRSEVLHVLGEHDGATGRGRAGELEWVIDERILSCTALRVNFGPDGKFVEAFTEYITY